MATVHMMFAFRHFVPYLGAMALALALLAVRAGDPPQRARVHWMEPAIALLILGVHAVHAEARSIIDSLQGLGSGGEYAAEGTAGYARDFTPAMRRNAADTRGHWARRNMGRPPRIWTFAAGALPYEYADAYIFEELESFRHRCPASEGGERPDARHWRGHAGYIHAFTRHGRLSRLLAPSPRARRRADLGAIDPLQRTRRKPSRVLQSSSGAEPASGRHRRAMCAVTRPARMNIHNVC